MDSRWFVLVFDIWTIYFFKQSAAVFVLFLITLFDNALSAI